MFFIDQRVRNVYGYVYAIYAKRYDINDIGFWRSKTFNHYEKTATKGENICNRIEPPCQNYTM
jgi:hypothetical protein